MNDQDDKPPSNNNQDNPELCVPRGRDLHRIIVGCRTNPQSRYHFGGLAMFSSDRRNCFLEIDKTNE